MLWSSCKYILLSSCKEAKSYVSQIQIMTTSRQILSAFSPCFYQPCLNLMSGTRRCVMACLIFKRIPKSTVKMTDILSEACRFRFRKRLIEETNVDPFSCVTIASACMKVLCTNFLLSNTLAISSSDNYRKQFKCQHPMVRVVSECQKYLYFTCSMHVEWRGRREGEKQQNNKNKY